MDESHAAFRARWREVNAIQEAEVCRLSSDERFDQLSELFNLLASLRKDVRNTGEIRHVRQRWATLRRRHLAHR